MFFNYVNSYANLFRNMSLNCTFIYFFYSSIGFISLAESIKNTVSLLPYMWNCVFFVSEMFLTLSCYSFSLVVLVVFIHYIPYPQCMLFDLFLPFFFFFWQRLCFSFLLHPHLFLSFCQFSFIFFLFFPRISVMWFSLMEVIAS